MEACLINGRPAVLLPVEDRGLAYGDGLFETLAVRAGRVRFLDRHLGRLEAGAGRLGFPVPDLPAIRSELLGLAAGQPRALLKLILTRGTGPRGYAPPAPAEPRRVIALYRSPVPAARPYRDGVRLRYCDTRIGHSPALAGMKTLNRLEQVLARAEWSDATVAEGLMRDPDGHVVCGTMSNLFIVRAGVLCTPAVDRCGVAGVMRATVLAAAAVLALPVQEGCLRPEEVAEASEVFVTNSQIGLWPVAAIDGQGYVVPGPVTARLMAALAAQGVDECALR